ncbi:MAG: hypothetical protein AB7G93_14150 [Bdellovibrionales bacterium]
MQFETLIQQPESLRDDTWEARFLAEIIKTNVQVEQEEPREGRDGWPYLFVRTDAGQEPFVKVVQWLATRGIGLVVNAHKMMPDYIFTYGMIWNFVQTGRFRTPGATLPPGEVVFEPGQDVLMGDASEAYLPVYVRSVLRQFLNSQGFIHPKILVASSGDYKNVDLIVSQESLNDLRPSSHSVFAEALSWFLPPHYSIVLASERNLPKVYDL